MNHDAYDSENSSLMDASENDPLIRDDNGIGHFDRESRVLIVDDEFPETDAPSRSPVARAMIDKFPWLHAYWEKISTWVEGPSPPAQLQFIPLLDRRIRIRGHQFSLGLESWWLKATTPYRTKLVLGVAIVAYLITLSQIVRVNWYQIPQDSFIGCTAAFWSAKDGCGMNGEWCGPFQSDEPEEYRCPARCSAVKLLNIRTVGDEEVIYKPLVIGGGDELHTYRADSWICASALQSGLISDKWGGCVAVHRVGNHTSFIESVMHGISSIAFPSQFPFSYQLSSSTSLTHCKDLRPFALLYNITTTVLVFLLLRPKPLVLFWCLVCIGFWHVTFFSDPRDEPPPVSDAFEFFLPTLFVCYAFWKHAFKHTMVAFTAVPLERALWYLIPFWCGTLSNVLFDSLPLDRFIISDIVQRPGALTTVVILALVVSVIIINQIRIIRLTGWLPKYLTYYGSGAAVVLVLSLLPGLTFRVHHYVFSIVLMAGTAWPTRPSAAYQAFLLGMFLNGVSRWGFDSILQTADELRRDAPLGSSLPTFLTNSTYPLMNVTSTLSWKAVEKVGARDEGWNGFALLVDDVLRYAGPALEFSLEALDLSPLVPHFFRLAYRKGDSSGDFTKAAIWYPNGTFVDPLPGPS